jgi:hypothetical protein
MVATSAPAPAVAAPAPPPAPEPRASGTLVVRAHPRDAVLHVDGRPFDGRRPRPIEAGEHVLSAQRSGYKDAFLPFFVGAREAASLDVRLTPAHPRRHGASSKAGAATQSKSPRGR